MKRSLAIVVVLCAMVLAGCGEGGDIVADTAAVSTDPTDPTGTEPTTDSVAPVPSAEPETTAVVDTLAPDTSTPSPPSTTTSTVPGPTTPSTDPPRPQIPTTSTTMPPAPTTSFGPIPGPCPAASHVTATVAGCGDTGALVEEVQGLLQCVGWPLDVDGIFGSATYQGVVWFQRSAGLEADGLAGPATIDQMVMSCEAENSG